MARYRLTFEFAETATQAQTLCDQINARQSAYLRKNHPAHFTPWNSQDGSAAKYICWYHA